MRSPRAPAWARSCIFAAALINAVAALASSAAAEEKFKRLFVFGDSYADVTLETFQVAPFPPGLWRIYPVPLQKDLGIPEIFDFAVGGATASNLSKPPIPPFWNLPQQVEEFLKTKPVLGPRDLVTVSIGGNDGRGFLQFGGTVADAPKFAAETATLATGQIKKLVDEAGAQTFVLAGFSGLSGLRIDEVLKNPDAANAFGRAYFDQMQIKLGPLAESGVRFFMLDLHRLGVQVEANLSGYGFAAVQCPVAFVLVCGGDINSPLQKQFFLGPDGLHLTNGGFELVAAYMANIVQAPNTIAVQPGIVVAASSNFTGSILGRLDSTREPGIAAQASTGGGGPMGLGYGGKSPPPSTAGSASRVTVYTMGTFAGGHRSDLPDMVGFDYESTAGTLGIEYRVNRNLVVGVAGNTTAASADLRNDASIDIDALQAALYFSYATRLWFVDALVSYGHHDLDLARPGVIDWVRSSTSGDVFAAAVRGGHLFDLGGWRAGPIAGLSYVHSRLDGYSEKGDQLLAYNVSSQTLDALTGSMGIRFLAPFLADGNVFIPFLNITLEHQFGDDGRTLKASLAQAPLLPIFSSVPNFDTRTYGKVEGGVTFQIGPDLSATINAASTFARDEGNDYRVSTGLNYRF